MKKLNKAIAGEEDQSLASASDIDDNSHLSNTLFFFPRNASPKLPFLMYAYTSKFVSEFEENASNLTMLRCRILPRVRISALNPWSWLLLLLLPSPRSFFTVISSSLGIFPRYAGVVTVEGITDVLEVHASIFVEGIAVIQDSIFV
ncbi:hypothetical protein Scep_007597 [Stephania cephalantha]|uniref:Uncharacterized protein n=1 Tax=Stephania cephalantha TaxID=152367 RepID=A0AAP0PNZ6_9MAGN